MPRPRRARASAVVLAVVLLPCLLLGVLPRGAAADDSFTGIDGQPHHLAPVVVTGARGTDYLGDELDSACRYGGAGLTRQLRQLAKLARLIRRSGRRVVWTVAPQKSAVDHRDLPPTADLPHGRCDALGLAQQDAVLDGFRDPGYLTVRRDLEQREQRGQQMYWPIDAHWTTLSTAVFAKALAARLSPRVGALQRYGHTQETITPDLAVLGLVPPTTETGPARYSTAPVVVTPLPPAPQTPPGLVVPPVRWVTRPAANTVRGRTVVVGDSFSARAIGNLSPVFHHATWLLIHNDSDDYPYDAVVDGIVAARIVVLEVVQRSVGVSVLANPLLRRALRAALS